MDIQTSHEEEVNFTGYFTNGSKLSLKTDCGIPVDCKSGVINWNDEENLSVAAYMNYTRLFQPPLSNSPLNGAQTIRAVTGEV